MIKNFPLLGHFLALLGALLWGISGGFAQFLFHNKGISPDWIVCFRLWGAGLFLLLISFYKDQSSLFSPFKNKQDLVQIFAFSIFGMFAVQYTYFVAIELSNVATATILHYLGPIFVVTYYAVVEKRFPKRKEIIAIIFAVIGTFIMMTNGSWDSLALSQEALLWGLLSALTLGTYSILPIKLLKKYNATLVVGWGMFLAGIITTPFFRPWEISGSWDMQSFLMIAFIVLIGGAGAFMAYLVAVKLIGATKASLLACSEPLVAMLMAALWLNVSFTFYSLLSMLIILVAIILVLTPSKT